MAPEEYEDNLMASKVHRIDHTIDMFEAAASGMSPIGFKNPNQMVKDRNGYLKKLSQQRTSLLGASLLMAQNNEKIKRDRDRLKSEFQSEIKRAVNV